MSTVLERLRAANSCIEAQFAKVDKMADALPERRTAYEELSRIGAVVHDLGPALTDICNRSDSPLQSEVERYAANLIRLQHECETAVVNLNDRRRHLWQEEQSMRLQHGWKEHF